jgi:hypothetical protein
MITKETTPTHTIRQPEPLVLESHLEPHPVVMAHTTEAPLLVVRLQNRALPHHTPHAINIEGAECVKQGQLDLGALSLKTSEVPCSKPNKK